MMKRTLDLLLALFGLLLLSPLFLILAAVCGFYVQERVGRGGRLFRMYKFRTMVKNADKSGQLITVGGDSRITPIGRILRRFKIDELPQLVNVVKGDMSFVGPRPEVKKYVDLYTPEQRRVLELRPGITDQASLEFFNEEAVLAASKDPERLYREELIQKKIAINLRYAGRSNVWRDFVLILATVLRAMGFRAEDKKLGWWIGAFALFTLALGLGMTLFFPGYIQNLLAHPDGSYLCNWLMKHQLKNPQKYTPDFYATYIPEVIVRILWMVFVFGSMTMVIAWKCQKALRDFWNHQETAFNLGVLRISLMWLYFIFDLSSLNSLTELQPEGMNIFFGYSWVKPFMPLPAWFVNSAWNTYLVLVILVMIGFLSRITVPLLTFVSFWVLLGPQLVGKMNHYHHVWVALLFMSFSRPGDALSVDWLIRKMRGKAEPVHRYDIRYGRPFVYLWMCMGAIYFFPGFWKFAAGGFAWAFSDNVQLKILAKIFETGEQPVIPLYNYPVLCQLGGLGTLILEMLFPFAMIFPKTRALFAVGGILFHEGNRRITQIGFTSIEFLYPSFVDWTSLVRLVKTKLLGAKDFVVAGVGAPRGLPKWQTGICIVVVGLGYLMGIIALETWPWAVYPTFAPLEQKFVNSIEMRVQAPSKVEKIFLQDNSTLINAYTNRTRLRSYMNLVMTQQDPVEREKMLKSLFELWRKENPSEPVQGVEFWQVQVPLLPLGAPPVPYKILGKM